MAKKSDKDQTLTQVVANNVRDYAYLRRIDQATLAAHMTSRGFPIKKPAISAITAGRRTRLSVDETAAFADIFDVSFMDMLTPHSAG